MAAPELAGLDRELASVLRKLDRWFTPATRMNAAVVLVPLSMPIKALGSNPLRVAMAISVPATATQSLYMGDSHNVSSSASTGTGFPLLAAETWTFGPEYVGDVWLFSDVAMTARVIELVATAQPLRW